MTTQRISFDIDAEEYKYLKMCCAKSGTKIKDFITKAIIQKVYDQEEVWFSELDEKEEGDLEFIPFEKVLQELQICV